MGAKKVEHRKGSWLIGAFLLVILLSQGCGGGGSGESGGVAVSSSDGSEAAVGAEMAAVRGSRAGTVEGFDRMVVKTAELGLRSEDVRGSAAEAREVSARFGGDVLSSRVYEKSGDVSADLVISVPSGEFEAALDELRGLGGRITTDSTEGQDVTEEFVDLESRERNLLAAEESLLALYEKAESVDDTLEVERELTQIRGEIEQVQGRIRYLEKRTSSSEISLTIEPTATARPEPAWSPRPAASRAWDASLLVLQAAATATISAVVFCWWLLPAFVAGLVWWRRSRASL
ncbi:DUF4349 domain-containing protein [Rubrobacter tropicus]|uniref:DUF4349 domain-containing protein n=1 Tax=Rubrobacter tropicus TaxID=2653851 RepID=A0A6G8QEE1_9ACTN|nr:DUF4349 domain-containing protein [Rubrobacter tropicus]QIN84866.1 DUF4349 domain-containing protein [Rubrobacter tropicus]